MADFAKIARSIGPLLPVHINDKRPLSIGTCQSHPFLEVSPEYHRQTEDGAVGNPDQLVALINAFPALVEERDALQRFKDFVHERLDDAGVPTHPNGPHSAEGCRIGDRLDIALAADVEIIGWNFNLADAPRDATPLFLLIDHSAYHANGLEQESATHSRTVGFNNFDHDGEDVWTFAGWNWSQDEFEPGRGLVVAFAPMPPMPVLP